LFALNFITLFIVRHQPKNLTSNKHVFIPAPIFCSRRVFEVLAGLFYGSKSNGSAIRLSIHGNWL